MLIVGSYLFFFSGMPKLDTKTTKYTGVYDRDDYDDKWHFPTEVSPGNWIQDSEIRLVTLSGVLWHGSRGGELYKAEYEGEKERLNLHDFILYMTPRNEYQENQMKGLEHIDTCINKGIKVKKARLLERVKNWTPYLLWSFAIDCVEHAYSLHKDYLLDIYKEGIIFARAYSRSSCGMGEIELEAVLDRWADKGKYPSYEMSLGFKYKLELEKAINKAIESDITTPYLGKAIIEAIDPYNPFTVANYVRTAISMLQRKYRDEYDYPDIAKDYQREQVLLDRIWHALQKKEFDWQVNHLSEILGE